MKALNNNYQLEYRMHWDLKLMIIVLSEAKKSWSTNLRNFATFIFQFYRWKSRSVKWKTMLKMLKIHKIIIINFIQNVSICALLIYFTTCDDYKEINEWGREFIAPHFLWVTKNIN